MYLRMNPCPQATLSTVWTASSSRPIAPTTHQTGWSRLFSSSWTTSSAFEKGSRFRTWWTSDSDIRKRHLHSKFGDKKFGDRLRISNFSKFFRRSYEKKSGSVHSGFLPEHRIVTGCCPSPDSGGRAGAGNHTRDQK